MRSEEEIKKRKRDYQIRWKNTDDREEFSKLSDLIDELKWVLGD